MLLLSHQVTILVHLICVYLARTVSVWLKFTEYFYLLMHLLNIMKLLVVHNFKWNGKLA